jgi:hypothetical protein
MDRNKSFLTATKNACVDTGIFGLRPWIKPPWGKPVLEYDVYICEQNLKQ